MKTDIHKHVTEEQTSLTVAPQCVQLFVTAIENLHGRGTQF
jgi:hypothetical protein